MIEDKDIRDINHAKSILNQLREYTIAYEEQIGEMPEEICEDIVFQLAEIDGFIIGNQQCTNSNFAMADMRVMCYWEYLEGKCNFNKLMKNLKEYEGEV